MQFMQSRRRFLATASMAGAAALVGAPGPLYAEPPPETTTVRLPKWDTGGYCWAAQFVAAELLRAEGFTDVRFVLADPKVDNSEWIARGDTDFDLNYPPKQIASIESGVPIKVLTGLHAGCLELIANDSIRSVTDLRGKRVAVDGFNTSRHTWLTLIAAYVGLDPVNDIKWVTGSAHRRGHEPAPEYNPVEMLAEGEVDAFLASPPWPQKLRGQKFGHTILANAVDRPWSQYFCCMVSGRADYVDRYPIATKRVVRAILKAADLCVSNPKMVARLLVERGILVRYDYAVATLADIRYDRWREFDPEDSLRFYALRMSELGMIKSTPDKIIADGTDWRFLNEVKRELKA